MQFQLAVGFIAAGLSFRQVNNVLNEMKRLIKLAVGCVNDADVAYYARAVYAINLQVITSILVMNLFWHSLWRMMHQHITQVLFRQSHSLPHSQIQPRLSWISLSWEKDEYWMSLTSLGGIMQCKQLSQNKLFLVKLANF